MDAAYARRLLAVASAFKEGDLAVGGTRDDRLREDARRELLAVSVRDLRRTALVEDSVSEFIDRGRERTRDGDIDALTIGQVKEILLGRDGAAWTRACHDALPSEVAAAVVKVMAGEELGQVASAIFNPLNGGAGHGLGATGVVVGDARHFGSRIQPNSAGDDEEEILFSILDGLAHGCGDVIIGLNPAADELDTIVRLESLLARVVNRLGLPTRFCVLSDIVKQHLAQQRTRVDVGFQSLAGTSTALTGMVGLDATGILDLARSFDGLYFETGQGSAVTNGTAEGVDMVTLEARCYGVARAIRRATGTWTIVNDVAGFIGPEVFRTPEQLERACLEDLVMAKLHGLTMGVDVCATFHMGISPSELHAVTERVVERGAPAYLMAVAGNADPMLGYLTTAYRDHLPLRRRTGRVITTAMQRRLDALGASSVAELHALYQRAGGDTRPLSRLAEDGRRTLAKLRDRGLDLGTDGDGSARLAAIYENARRALYATIDDDVLNDVAGNRVLVRTEAGDRDDYLAHPSAGERIRRTDTVTLREIARTGSVRQIQIVISDGLNANAINGQLRTLLPAVRRSLRDAGCGVSEADVVVRNGRVRAGYHVGALLEPEVIVHVIGERPGTGLDTASAYLTYGRDERGQSRWDPQLDHSCTTAVCGIHRQGKKPETAAGEIARAVVRMLEQRRSGVSLR